MERKSRKKYLLAGIVFIVLQFTVILISNHQINEKVKKLELYGVSHKALISKISNAQGGYTLHLYYFVDSKRFDKKVPCSPSWDKPELIGDTLDIIYLPEAPEVFKVTDKRYSEPW